MKIFLSSIETAYSEHFVPKLIESGVKLKWNLMSYYYLRDDKKYRLAELIRDNSQEIMIDSGAHSFQKGKKVNWLEYTKQYADFIKKFDRPNVIGYFEMDVDGVIGYEKVLELRKILESVSNKIIPVWHKNRGISEFKKMCQEHRGGVVAITGFKNEDIKDDQYLMFLKYAKKYDCKVHCLGMTRKKVLDKVPFDYVDSSSWKQSAIYGKIGGKKVDHEFQKKNGEVITRAAYLEGMKLQKHYYRKWKR